ncbi:MAG TPA: magnesium transporter CorA family protein [Candidatus Nanoarchaeia archaeon]|nr:magnesium transporter CorA family protein [Candidatus Nanoarchaeia archaeon]
MITYYKRTITAKHLKILDSYEEGSWINVINPTPEELESLEKDFSLNRELLDEGLDEHELPRLDSENGHLYLFVKTIFREKKSLGTLLIILNKDFVLTLAKDEPHSLKQIFDEKEEMITTQKTKFVIKLLSLINDNFEYVVSRIVKDVQSKKRITVKLKESEIEDLLQDEDFLNNLVVGYYYTSLLYSKMLKKIDIYEEDKEAIKDLIVESNQGLNLCRSSLKTISNLRHYYSIILSNKLNRTIKILTAFTILITLSAAVSSLYGMNIILPFQQNPHAFWYILSFMAGTMGIFIYYFYQKGIL